MSLADGAAWENENGMRTFSGGATRDTDQNKLDYEAFLSPLVLEMYATYMHGKRVQPDGNLRDGDNWQKGIPKKEYIKSAYRHFMHWWLLHRGFEARDERGNEVCMEETLCALLFNIMGYLHETRIVREEN